MKWPWQKPVGGLSTDNREIIFSVCGEDFALALLNKVNNRALEALLNAARKAGSQAREEVQPVAKPAPFDQGGIGHAMYQAFHAYRADYVLSTDGADYVPTPFERELIEDFFAGLMAEEAFFGPIRALYDTHTTPPAPGAEKLRLDAQVVETAIGGAYDLPDGRGFWIDAVAAREMTKRVLAALQQEGR